MNNFSLEAEQSVLGAVLVSPENNAGVIDHTDIDHFTKQSHRAIWSAIEGYAKQGQPFDMFSVAQTMQTVGELELAGGMEYITEICESAHSVNPLLVKQYWKILDDHKTRRNTESAAMSVLNAVREIKDVDQMLNAAQSALNSISSNVNVDTLHLRNAMASFLERQEKLLSLKEGQMVGRQTGIKALDHKTMGFETGLIIIAGRPAMGKSVMAVEGCLADAKEGKASLVISLEMPADQLAQRCVSNIGSIAMDKLKDPRTMSSNDVVVQTSAIHQLMEYPIEIMDKMDSKISRVCQTIRAWHRRTPNAGRVVIDYLQLMATNTANGTKNDAVGEITRQFKMLSNELDLTIVLVSQLNRSLEQRNNKRPIASDLRDSGNIEQDADMIVFVYRDEVYNESTPYKGVVEFIVGKHRTGETGTVYAGSQLQYQRFTDLAPDYEPPAEEKLSKKF